MKNIAELDNLTKGTRRREFEDGLGMAGVGMKLGAQGLKEGIAVRTSGRGDRCGAELQAGGIGPGLSSQALGDELVAIADAQKGKSDGDRPLNPRRYGFAPGLSIGHPVMGTGKDGTAQVLRRRKRCPTDGVDVGQAGCCHPAAPGDPIGEISPLARQFRVGGPHFEDRQWFHMRSLKLKRPA